MLYRTDNPHGGDVYGAPVRLDFSANVNPLGPPPRVIAALQAAAADVRQYPDPYCRALLAAIAAHESLPPETIRVDIKKTGDTDRVVTVTIPESRR